MIGAPGISIFSLFCASTEWRVVTALLLKLAMLMGFIAMDIQWMAMLLELHH
jgi:hypothetical protein